MTKAVRANVFRKVTAAAIQTNYSDTDTFHAFFNSYNRDSNRYIDEKSIGYQVSHKNVSNLKILSSLLKFINNIDAFSHSYTRYV